MNIRKPLITAISAIASVTAHAQITTSSDALFLRHEDSGLYYALNSANQLELTANSTTTAQGLRKVAKDGGYAFQAVGGAMSGMYTHEPSDASRQELTADFSAAEVFFENDCGDDVVAFTSGATGSGLKNESNNMLGNASGNDCGSSANEFTWVGGSTTPTPTPSPTPAPTPSSDNALFLQHEDSGLYYALNSDNQLELGANSTTAAQGLRKVAKDGGYAFQAVGGAMSGMYSHEPSGTSRQELTADFSAAEVFFENDCGDDVVAFTSGATGSSLKNESNNMLGNASGNDCGSSANEFTWVSGSATPTPIVTPTPSPTPTPTPTEGSSDQVCNIDMTIWGYTVGDGQSRNERNDIQNLVNNETIGNNEITWSRGCPTFTADNIANSSSNSPFTRAELRELTTMYFDDSFDDSDIENQWVTSKASSSIQNAAGGVNGTLEATLKVNTVSVDGKEDQVGRIVVAQIHGVDDEPLKLYYQKLPEHTNGSVFFNVDGSDGDSVDRVYIIGYSDKDYSRHNRGVVTLEDPANGIPLGDIWSYRVDLSGDQLRVTVWHDGNTYTTEDAIAYTRRFRDENDQDDAVVSNSSDTDAITIGSHFDNDLFYFKAGAYNQNNTGTGSPNFASVTFYQIEVSHD